MGSLADQAKAVADLVQQDPLEGLRRADALADQARSAGAADALTVILRAAAWAARQVLQYDRADELLEECITVAAAEGLDARLAEALVTRCGYYLERGRTDLAQADVERARALTVPGIDAEIAFTEGLVTTAIGTAHDAVAAYERALIHLPVPAEPNLEGKICNNLGMLHTRMGRYDQADAVLVRAAAVVGPSRGVLLLIVTANRAELALRRGNPSLALARYAELEALGVELGVPLVELYREKADALASMQLLDEAAQAARLAVESVRGGGDVSMILVESLLTLARTARARGELDVAVDTATEAVDLARAQGWTSFQAAAGLIRLEAMADRDGQAGVSISEILDLEDQLARLGQQSGAISASLMVAWAMEERGATSAAVDAYTRAAGRADASGPIDSIRAHLARAAVRRIAGDRAGCLDECGRGLDVLDRYRAGVGSSELRARAAVHGQSLAQIGLTVAHADGDVDLVWRWMERSRAADAPPGRAAIDGDVALMLAEIRELETALLTGGDDAGAVSAGRLAELEGRVRERLWMRDDLPGGGNVPGRDLASSQRFDPTDVVDGLAGRALVQVGPIGGQMVAVVVTGEGRRLVSLGPAGPLLETCGQLNVGIGRLGSTRSPAVAKAVGAAVTRCLDSLGAGFWDPLGIDLASVSEVIISPPAALMGVPWGSVPGLAQRPVRVVPSVRLWHDTSTRSREMAADGYRSGGIGLGGIGLGGIGLGGIVLAAGPRLDGAAEEIRRIDRVYGGTSTMLVEAAATGRAVLDAADGAGLVHLACHGHLRTDAPTFSSVEMVDGPLTLQEFESLSRPAHHWILAACEMGNPGKVVGPALQGMVSTLLGGGAGAVVASTANLPDAVSADLMVTLHHELAGGRSIAEALWTARRSADTDTPDGFAASLMLTCFGGG